MSTVSSTEAPVAPSQGRRWYSGAVVPELWAALAITVMWLAVLFDALFGPDFVSANGNGATVTRIPSAIIVALFAYLGTRVVARYGFGRHRAED